jgi:hypothetical protein
MECQLARLDLGRPRAGDSRVDDEGRECCRDGQRDDEPGRTPPHTRKLTAVLLSARRRSHGGPARGTRDRDKANQASLR